MSTPKQLAKRRKLEKKRLRKREARLKRQKTRLHSEWPIDDDWPVALASGPVDGVKMSEVLGEFVAPLISEYGADDYEKILQTGIIAWNVALEPEHRRNSILAAAVDIALPEASNWERYNYREILDDLVAQKLQDFAEYCRPIMSFNLERLDNGKCYLTVFSGLSR